MIAIASCTIPNFPNNLSIIFIFDLSKNSICTGDVLQKSRRS